jgi:hypothetical protein
MSAEEIQCSVTGCAKAFSGQTQMAKLQNVFDSEHPDEFHATCTYHEAKRPAMRAGCRADKGATLERKNRLQYYERKEASCLKRDILTDSTSRSHSAN